MPYCNLTFCTRAHDVHVVSSGSVSQRASLSTLKLVGMPASLLNSVPPSVAAISCLCRRRMHRDHCLLDYMVCKRLSICLPIGADPVFSKESQQNSQESTFAAGDNQVHHKSMRFQLIYGEQSLPSNLGMCRSRELSPLCGRILASRTSARMASQSTVS